MLTFCVSRMVKRQGLLLLSLWLAIVHVLGFSMPVNSQRRHQRKRKHQQERDLNAQAQQRETLAERIKANPINEKTTPDLPDTIFPAEYLFSWHNMPPPIN